MTGPGVGAAFEALADALEEAFAEGVEAPWPAGRFEELARRAFRLQYEAIPAYRGFCEARGATLDRVAGWRDVPPVPATAFKHLDLGLFGAERAERVFRTSGTTRGARLRGRHPVPRLSLYRAASLPHFRAHLAPEDDAPALLSLLPSPDDVPDSSLSTMIGFVAEEVASSVAWLAAADGRVEPEALVRAAGAVEEGTAVLLVGTAFGFVHLLDGLSGGDPIRLPAGSRVMETGGFKGRAREVSRDELYAGIEARLGVPRARIVNEYGMTELLSQLYEPTLREGGPSGGHVPPPWLAVRALDPETLAPLPEGEPGLLAFFDLANVGSVCAVLTEDVGAVADGRVRLAGRTRGAEPRGCSLAMEELLEASGAGP